MLCSTEKGINGTMFIRGQSGETKLIYMMNQYSPKNQDPAQKS